MDEDFDGKMLDELSAPAVLDNHPDLKAFQGDKSISAYATDAGQVYEDTVREKMPHLADKLPELRQNFEDQARKRAQARIIEGMTDKYKSEGNTWGKYITERTPYAGMFMAAEPVKTAIAEKRIKQGDADAEHYFRVAESIADQQREAEKGWARKTLDVATQIPRAVVEFGAAAGPAEGADLAVRGLVGTGLLGKAAGMAAGGAVLGATALAPEAVGRAAADVVEGESPTSAIPREALSSLIEGTIFHGTGALGAQAGKSFMAKFLYGLGAVQGNKELQRDLGLQPGSGVGKTLLTGTNEERIDALKDFATDAVVMGGLASLTHIFERNPKIDQEAMKSAFQQEAFLEWKQRRETADDTFGPKTPNGPQFKYGEQSAAWKTAFADAYNFGRENGYSEDGIKGKFRDIKEKIDEALRRNPNATNAELREEFADFVDNPFTEFAYAWVDAIRPEAAGAPPPPADERTTGAPAESAAVSALGKPEGTEATNGPPADAQGGGALPAIGGSEASPSKSAGLPIKEAEAGAGRGAASVPGGSEAKAAGGSQAPEGGTVSTTTLKQVQRHDEAGQDASFDKPHGIYTTPAGVESPHAELGKRSVWDVNPAASVLHITETADQGVVMRKGAVNAGAGVWAARHFLGATEFARLKGLPKAKLVAEVAKAYPSVEWGKYHDKQEVMEAVGGLEARKAGYDAIQLTDPKDERFTEFVGLTEKSMSRQAVPAKTGVKDFATEVQALADSAPATESTPETRGARYRGDKVFIGHLYDEYQKAHPEVTRAQFDKLILENRDKLELVRADMVPYMHEADVRESTVPYLNATFNFVRANEPAKESPPPEAPKPVGGKKKPPKKSREELQRIDEEHGEEAMFDAAGLNDREKALTRGLLAEGKSRKELTELPMFQNEGKPLTRERIRQIAFKVAEKLGVDPKIFDNALKAEKESNKADWKPDDESEGTVAGDVGVGGQGGTPEWSKLDHALNELIRRKEAKIKRGAWTDEDEATYQTGMARLAQRGQEAEPTVPSQRKASRSSAAQAWKDQYPFLSTEEAQHLSRIVTDHAQQNLLRRYAGDLTLFDAVMRETKGKGIKPSKDFDSTWATEEGLPKGLFKKGGVPLDDLAKSLKMDAEELLEGLKEHKIYAGSKWDEFQLQQEERAHYENEARKVEGKVFGRRPKGRPGAVNMQPFIDAAKAWERMLAEPPPRTMARGILRHENASRVRRADRDAEALHAAKRRFWAIEALPDGPEKTRRFLAIQNVKQGRAPLSSLGPRDQEYVRASRRLHDEYTQALLAEAILSQALQDHVMQQWRDPKNPNASADDLLRALLAKRPLAGKESFRKQRTIASWEDGINAGLVPVSWNPAELDLREFDQYSKSLFGRRAFFEMKKMGLAVTQYQAHPSDWVRPQIEDKLWDVLTPNGRTIHYVMPKEVAHLLENHLSSGLEAFAARQGGKLGALGYRAFRGVGNQMSQMLLGWNLFHATEMVLYAQFDAANNAIQAALHGQWGLAKEQVPGVLIPGYAAARSVAKAMAMEKEWLSPGSGTPEARLVAGWLEIAGGRNRGGHEYMGGAIEQFQKSIAMIRHSPDLLSAAKRIPGLAYALPALNTLVSKPIMDYLVPSVKRAVFADRAKIAMAKLGPNPSIYKVREALMPIWDQMDKQHGLYTYDNLFYNRAIRDLYQTFFLSFGWNLGTMQLAKGAFRAAVDPAKWRALFTGRDVDMNIGFILALMGGTAIYSALYQLIATGKPPEDFKDLYAPQTGRERPDGTADRVMFPTYMRDLATLLNRADEPLRIPQNAYEMLKHKRHPLITLAADLFSNEDWQGKAIVNPNDPASAQLQDAGMRVLDAFLPISVHQAKREDLDTAQKAQAFFGITPASSNVVHTNDEQRVRELRNRNSPVQKKLRDERRRGIFK